MYCGLQASGNNCFTIGTALTKICVMYGETAAVATFSRRLAKAKKNGEALEAIVQEMNDFVDKYNKDSQAIECARMGFVDELVELTSLRNYLTMFVSASYQNPLRICPQNMQMLLRTIA